jgi:hypothetical protein
MRRLKAIRNDNKAVDSYYLQASMKLGDGMNPGYLSFVLITMVLILLASGWKDILFQGTSWRGISLFFAGWVLVSTVQVSFGAVEVRLTIPYLLLLSIAATGSMDTLLQKGHVWCAGILLGLFDLLMKELDGWSLFTKSMSPGMNSGIALAVLAVLLGRSPVWQFIAVSAGLVTSELLYAWLHRYNPSVVGGAAFSDHWWYVFCLARALTVLAERAVRVLAGTVKHWTKR